MLISIYWDKIKATISPYRPRASAKMSISIIPTNTLSCWPKALTQASPAIPIANPAPNELRPQHNPEARWEKPR